ncbi:MAG: hypothetical protein WC335_08490, partial [Candidatus Omnitrophota bacterium]
MAVGTVVLGLHSHEIAELFTEPSDLVRMLVVAGSVSVVEIVLLKLFERVSDARSKDGKILSIKEVFLAGAVAGVVPVFTGTLALIFVNGRIAELLKNPPIAEEVGTRLILIGLMFGVWVVWVVTLIRGDLDTRRNNDRIENNAGKEQEKNDGGDLGKIVSRLGLNKASAKRADSIDSHIILPKGINSYDFGALIGEIRSLRDIGCITSDKENDLVRMVRNNEISMSEISADKNITSGRRRLLIDNLMEETLKTVIVETGSAVYGENFDLRRAFVKRVVTALVYYSNITGISASALRDLPGYGSEIRAFFRWFKHSHYNTGNNLSEFFESNPVMFITLFEICRDESGKYLQGDAAAVRYYLTWYFLNDLLTGREHGLLIRDFSMRRDAILSVVRLTNAQTKEKSVTFDDLRYIFKTKEGIEEFLAVTEKLNAASEESLSDANFIQGIVKELKPKIGWGIFTTIKDKPILATIVTLWMPITALGMLASMSFVIPWLHPFDTQGGIVGQAVIVGGYSLVFASVAVIVILLLDKFNSRMTGHDAGYYKECLSPVQPKHNGYKFLVPLVTVIAAGLMFNYCMNTCNNLEMVGLFGIVQVPGLLLVLFNILTFFAIGNLWTLAITYLEIKKRGIGHIRDVKTAENNFISVFAKVNSLASNVGNRESRQAFICRTWEVLVDILRKQGDIDDTAKEYLFSWTMHQRLPQAGYFSDEAEERICRFVEGWMLELPAPLLWELIIPTSIISIAYNEEIWWDINMLMKAEENGEETVLNYFIRKYPISWDLFVDGLDTSLSGKSMLRSLTLLTPLPEDILNDKELVRGIELWVNGSKGWNVGRTLLGFAELREGWRLFTKMCFPDDDERTVEDILTKKLQFLLEYERFLGKEVSAGQKARLLDIMRKYPFIEVSWDDSLNAAYRYNPATDKVEMVSFTDATVSNIMGGKTVGQGQVLPLARGVLTFLTDANVSYRIEEAVRMPFSQTLLNELNRNRADYIIYGEHIFPKDFSTQSKVIAAIDEAWSRGYQLFLDSDLLDMGACAFYGHNAWTFANNITSVDGTPHRIVSEDVSLIFRMWMNGYSSRHEEHCIFGKSRPTSWNENLRPYGKYPAGAFDLTLGLLRELLKSPNVFLSQKLGTLWALSYLRDPVNFIASIAYIYYMIAKPLSDGTPVNQSSFGIVGIIGVLASNILISPQAVVLITRYGAARGTWKWIQLLPANSMMMVPYHYIFVISDLIGALGHAKFKITAKGLNTGWIKFRDIYWPQGYSVPIHRSYLGFMTAAAGLSWIVMFLSGAHTFNYFIPILSLSMPLAAVITLDILSHVDKVSGSVERVVKSWDANRMAGPLYRQIRKEVWPQNHSEVVPVKIVILMGLVMSVPIVQVATLYPVDKIIWLLPYLIIPGLLLFVPVVYQPALAMKIYKGNWLENSSRIRLFGKTAQFKSLGIKSVFMISEIALLAGIIYTASQYIPGNADMAGFLETSSSPILQNDTILSLFMHAVNALVVGSSLMVYVWINWEIFFKEFLEIRTNNVRAENAAYYIPEYPVKHISGVRIPGLWKPLKVILVLLIPYFGNSRTIEAGQTAGSAETGKDKQSQPDSGTVSGSLSDKSRVLFAGSENDSGSMSRAFNKDGGIRAGPRGSAEYYAVNLAAIFIISGLIAYFVSVYSAQGLVASFSLSSLFGFAAAISVLYLVIDHISPNKEHGAPLEQAVLKLRPDASSALIARVTRLMNSQAEQRHSAILSPLNLFKLAPIAGPALRAMERNRAASIVLAAVKWVGDVLTMLVIYRFLLRHVFTPLALASEAGSVSLNDEQLEKLIVTAEKQLQARRAGSTFKRAAYSVWDVLTVQFILDFSDEQIVATGARRAVSGDPVRKAALLVPLAFFIGVNALFSLSRQRIVIGLASMFAADYILKLLPLSMHAALNVPLVTIKFSWLYLPISDLPITGSLILSSFIIILVLDLIMIRNTVKEEKLTWTQKTARIVNMLVSGTVSMIFVGPEIEFAINFTSGMPVAGDTVRFMEEFVYGANGKEGLGQIIIDGVNTSSVSSFGVNPHKDVYNFIAGHNPFFASPDFDSASALDQLYNLRNRKAAETGAEQELGLINSLISEAESSELTAVAALGQYYLSEEKWLGEVRAAGYDQEEIRGKRDELLALIGAESKEGKDKAAEEARGIFTRDGEKFGLVAEGLRNYYAAHENENAVEFLVLDGAGLDAEKATAFNSTVSGSFFGVINDRQLLENYAETAVWNMFDGTAAGEEKAAKALEALSSSKAEKYTAGFASAAIASGDYSRLAQVRNASISANVTLSDPEKEVWLGEPDSEKVAEMSADITAITGTGASGDAVIGEETAEFGLKALYYDNPNVFDNALLSIAQNNYKEGTVQAVNSSSAVYDSVKNINSSYKNNLVYSVYQWQYDQADIIKEQLNSSDYTGAAATLKAIKEVDPETAEHIRSIVVSGLLWGDQASEPGLQSFDQAGLNKLVNFTNALNSTGSDVIDAAVIEEHNKTSRNAISYAVLGFMNWSLGIQDKMLSPVDGLVSKIASHKGLESVVQENATVTAAQVKNETTIASAALAAPTGLMIGLARAQEETFKNEDGSIFEGEAKGQKIELSLFSIFEAFLNMFDSNSQGNYVDPGNSDDQKPSGHLELVDTAADVVQTKPLGNLADAVKEVLSKSSSPQVISFGEVHPPEGLPLEQTALYRFSNEILPVLVEEGFHDLVCECFFVDTDQKEFDYYWQTGKLTPEKTPVLSFAVSSVNVPEESMYLLETIRKLKNQGKEITIHGGFSSVEDSFSSDDDLRADLIRQATFGKVEALREEGKRVVTYNGEAHNMIKPLSYNMPRDISFGDDLYAQLGDKYCSVFLFVPECGLNAPLLINRLFIEYVPENGVCLLSDNRNSMVSIILPFSNYSEMEMEIEIKDDVQLLIPEVTISYPQEFSSCLLSGISKAGALEAERNETAKGNETGIPSFEDMKLELQPWKDDLLTPMPMPLWTNPRAYVVLGFMKWSLEIPLPKNDQVEGIVSQIVSQRGMDEDAAQVKNKTTIASAALAAPNGLMIGLA